MVLIHNLLQNTIGDLHLPTGLRMIRCGQFVSYNILSHKRFKGSIAKVSTIITDDSTRGSKARENVLFQKNYDNYVIISFTWNDFYPLGPIKLIPQTSKSFIFRIGLRGIISRFEILLSIWHLGHILQNS